jgi:ammonia channel protein AmtB
MIQKEKGEIPMNSGDIVFVLISAAMVMLMTPGLALFYGGMVRNKNVLATLMQSFIILGLITLEWVFWGYSMAFGPDYRGLIGGLEWFGLSGVGADPSPVYGSTIPHSAFMIFQCIFAVITPALITGAFATGLFASAAINTAGVNGLFFGNPYQIVIQLVSVIATMAFSFSMTFIILKIIDLGVGLRVTDEGEERGLDITLHNEAGYDL